MALNIDSLIALLDLRPLPGEGGRYAETYRSPDLVPGAALPARYSGRERNLGTAIYYLLSADPDSFSALHCLKSDEVYHFYLGAAVEMLLLFPDGQSRRIRLGQDLAAGERVQLVVPAGTWQGSRLVPGGEYALLGTTMSPGFDPEDFELGSRDELFALFPREGEMIHRLTRA
jgi:uncharacterized protein